VLLSLLILDFFELLVIVTVIFVSLYTTFMFHFIANMDLKELGCVIVDWIHLAQDKG
jgi:hypothetical protein